MRGDIVEKLKAYLYCSAALICVFLFGGLLYASFEQDQNIRTASAESAPEPVIIIDTGHGGEDGGAEDNGVLEKDVNLAIALKLRDMLTLSGYKVRMTRESDISVYDSSASTVREKKLSDMKNRAELINSSENNILVSIHQNKFSQSKYSGAQMFYSDNHPESMKLAESIRKSVTSLLQPGNSRELKADKGSVYILKKAQIPAVIAECGFLSNPEEAKLLSDGEYQGKMAFAIMCGVMDFLADREENQNQEQTSGAAPGKL